MCIPFETLPKTLRLFLFIEYRLLLAPILPITAHIGIPRLPLARPRPYPPVHSAS